MSRGMHSSGTVGTFGAYAAAAKLLGLNGDKLRSGFGIAASFAAGIRCNFGTMTKPLHVGRAAENGVTAALLAARGFTADPDALDGPWGFYAVQGGGVSAEKTSQGFGKVWTIVDPGVSIKPYPCGVLTHPTIDLMLKLVTEHDVKPDDIDAVKVYAGTNILNPIRYPIAANHLQAKFSLPAGACHDRARAAKPANGNSPTSSSAPRRCKRCKSESRPSSILKSKKWASTKCARASRFNSKMDAESKAGPMTLPRRPGKSAERCRPGSKSALLLRWDLT